MLSNTEPDTAVFQMPFPSTGDHQRFEKGDLLHAGIHILRGSLSFKSRKNPTENRKWWWGRDIKNKKGEGTNVKMSSDDFPVLA